MTAHPLVLIAGLALGSGATASDVTTLQPADPRVVPLLGQRAGAPGLPSDPDTLEPSRPVATAAPRPIDATALILGGQFMGPIELYRQRPIPNTAPTHEEIKAVATPPEFRSPAAVSFGWSWKKRR